MLTHGKHIDCLNGRWTYQALGTGDATHHLGREGDHLYVIWQHFCFHVVVCQVVMSWNKNQLGSLTRAKFAVRGGSGTYQYKLLSAVQQTTQWTKLGQKYRFPLFRSHQMTSSWVAWLPNPAGQE